VERSASGYFHRQGGMTGAGPHAVSEIDPCPTCTVDGINGGAGTFVDGNYSLREEIRAIVAIKFS
jgi:hypothetical protein